MDEQHPIHFLRTQIIDVIEQVQVRFLTEDSLKNVIDLACEIIIEHFDLNNH